MGKGRSRFCERRGSRSRFCRGNLGCVRRACCGARGLRRRSCVCRSSLSVRGGFCLGGHNHVGRSVRRGLSGGIGLCRLRRRVGYGLGLIRICRGCRCRNGWRLCFHRGCGPCVRAAGSAARVAIGISFTVFAARAKHIRQHCPQVASHQQAAGLRPTSSRVSAAERTSRPAWPPPSTYMTVRTLLGR